MTYNDLKTIIGGAGIECPHVPIAWTKKEIPSVFVRYFFVTSNPDGHYNDKNKKTEHRITVSVHDKTAKKFEETFKTIKNYLEAKDGFVEMFDIESGRDPETGYFYKQGDIYYYEGE